VSFPIKNGDFPSKNGEYLLVGWFNKVGGFTWAALTGNSPFSASGAIDVEAVSRINPLLGETSKAIDRVHHQVQPFKKTSPLKSIFNHSEP